MAFEDFVRFDQLRSALDNKFVRFFCGDPNCEWVTTTHVDAAKRNLGRLNAILFQDDLEAGISRVADALGWHMDAVPQHKVSSSRSNFVGPDITRDVAYRFTQHDEEFVRFARDLADS